MLTITEMTEQEQVLAYKIEDELVAHRTMDEGTAHEYAAVCIERGRVYAQHLATMAIPAYLQVWAAEMAAHHRALVVKVHCNHLPWLAALMVVRYGEAVEHWPATVTEKDIARARDWKMGKDVPKAVSI